ncbi:hypothetical protein [Arabiibacter massiliensis]|uniref:hypothetical protein n=1 Tax=Arabiibacter massiliensis TaxID=1870985 RepID=UPI0009BBF3D5|nr:hypothetical protein [Arabiibacter massiliensis]
MEKIGERVMGEAAKLRAIVVRGEEEGGSEIVQTVIVLGFAVGLGAALMALQGNIATVIKSAGTSIGEMFRSVTAGPTL